MTFFSWAALAYSFKFVWAPLIDRLPVPILTRLLGRRRAWMLVAQGMIIAAILGMACTDPAGSEASLTLMALAAVLLGFSSATGYRHRRLSHRGRGARAASHDVRHVYRRLSHWYAGRRGRGSVPGRLFRYRDGALPLPGVALDLCHHGRHHADRCHDDAADCGAGAASRRRGRTQHTGVCAVRPAVCAGGEQLYRRFLFPADAIGRLQSAWSGSSRHEHVVGFVVEALRLGAAVLAAWGVTRLAIAGGVVDQAMVQTAYVDPVRDFFRRYGAQTAWLLLALVGIYRISDIVLGVIANVFYQDLGFSKAEIAAIVKTFGLFMTIAGGFLGGVLAVRYGVIRILMLGAVLSAATNCCLCCWRTWDTIL